MSKLPTVGKAHEATAAAAPFTWFVYGSSLDAAAFAAWADQHGYAMPDLAAGTPARLADHRLAFDVESRYWGGAAGSLVAAPGHAVEGLALRLPPEARGLVEHKEGAISGLYEPFEVTLAPLGGGPVLAAVAYRTSAARRLPAELPPSARWLDTVLAGAKRHGLSEAWLTELEELRRTAR